MVTVSKIVGESAVLGRRFHLDVFVTGERPARLMLLFGGSGIDAAEYARREATSPSILEAPVAAARPGLQLVFVTAPYDVPYSRMREDDDDAERWLEHVRVDVLARWPGPPVYVAAYSGGAALALNGVIGLGSIVGAGFLAADGLRADMDTGGLRASPLFIYNDGDPVLSRNRARAARLGRLSVIAYGLGHGFEGYAPALSMLIADAESLT